MADDDEIERALEANGDAAWVARMFKATREEQAAGYEHAESVANSAMQIASVSTVFRDHWMKTAENWLSIAATLKYLSERPR